jgi:hypothetical protein
MKLIDVLNKLSELALNAEDDDERQALNTAYTCVSNQADALGLQNDDEI